MFALANLLTVITGKHSLYKCLNRYVASWLRSVHIYESIYGDLSYLWDCLMIFFVVETNFPSFATGKHLIGYTVRSFDLNFSSVIKFSDAFSREIVNVFASIYVVCGLCVEAFSKFLIFFVYKRYVSHRFQSGFDRSNLVWPQGEWRCCRLDVFKITHIKERDGECFINERSSTRWAFWC